MLSPPDLPQETLLTALAEHWGIPASKAVYQPVGFGSHHWKVDTDWFVTVDESTDVRRLTSALRSAADVPVAVAPMPTREGEPLACVGRFAVALYPFVTGESFDWGEFRDDEHRRAALDMVVAVHKTPPRHAFTDDFTVPELPPIGDVGPYSRPAAQLLAEHAPALQRLRTRYDDLAHVVDRTRLVLTHGEPHPGNTMLTPDGWRLIDWDTALVAPPERDLWHLEPLDAAYEKATGVRPDPDMLALYRLRWDLTDLAEEVCRFSRPHTGTPNDEMGWQILRNVLTSL